MNQPFWIIWISVRDIIYGTGLEKDLFIQLPTTLLPSETSWACIRFLLDLGLVRITFCNAPFCILAKVGDFFSLLVN